MTHSALPPFSAWDGPCDARIVLVGEAWGGEEQEAARQGLVRPFVGEAGKELWLMLGEAWNDVAPEEHARVAALHRFGLAWVPQRQQWLEAASCAFTNVFNLRPSSSGNKLDSICGPRRVLPTDYAWPALTRSLYVLPEYLPEVTRLHQELASCRPNLVVALGNTACWALLRATNIGSIRGTTSAAYSEGPLAGMKVLPTYHPAAILYQWNLRTTAVADLMKARREMAFPDIRRPARMVLVSPELAEVQHYVNTLLQWPPELLATDTETSLGMIDTLSFADSSDRALVIPFGPHRQRRGQGWDTIWPQRNGHRVVSYWDAHEEVRVWELCQMLLEAEQVPKVLQNGLYDLQYFLRVGIRPRNFSADNMLLHHALFPELPKSLGFQGSIHTDEPAWKLMRQRHSDSEKRDE